MAVAKKSTGADPAPYPWLYYKSKTGSLHRWRVWSEGAKVFTEFGQVDGKHQITTGKVCEAMNTGKANARTAEEQAASVAKSMHDHKLNRKYSLTAAGAAELRSERRPPMLAHKLSDKPKAVRWPCDVQPKLDGNRCAVRWEDGEIKLVSRSTVKTYELPHLQKILAKVLPPDCEFDGELYTHGVHPQTINSWVTKNRPESAQIALHIYDMPVVDGDDSLPWEDRCARLLGLSGLNVPGLEVVPTFVAQNLDEVMSVHLPGFLKDGYEGAMLRNLDGIYAWGDRSADLLKVKVFDDSEFEVISAGHGVGKDAECVVWTCKSAAGPFTCKMKAPYEMQKKLYVERAKWIGQMLTVSYFGTFDSGLPRFPRGIKFKVDGDK